ncbi:hypothetical protein Tco_1293710 [Tanacetum coccineum]
MSLSRIAKLAIRHEGPLKLSEFNEEEELYAKFSKRELFWLSKYNFLVHLDDIARHSLDTSPAKIEAIKDWASPKTPTEIRQFLEGSENFVVYCDASHKGLGAVLMQREKSGDTTFNGTKVRVFTDHKSLQHILIPEGAEYEAKTLVRNSWLLRLLRSDITSESANRVANAQRIEERSKPLFEFEPWYDYRFEVGDSMVLGSLRALIMQDSVKSQSIPIHPDRISWAKVGDTVSSTNGPEIIHRATGECQNKSHIQAAQVRWNSRRGPEFTWEREDQMQKKYPHLFTNSAPAAEVAS